MIKILVKLVRLSVLWTSKATFPEPAGEGRPTQVSAWHRRAWWAWTSASCVLCGQRRYI